MEQSKPSVKWFIETQSQWFLQNRIPEWFHGVITRKDAENLLKDKPPGCFLIRVSESRIGYSLSYRTVDHYRHFMVDILKDQQCIIAGDTKVHMTLEDLVKCHTQIPLHPYDEILTLPCGQKTNATTDYAELFEDRKTFAPSLPISSKALTVSLADTGATVQPAFPPVPPRRRQASVTSSESTSTSCNLPPNLPGNRLYPALPTQPMMFNNGGCVLPNRTRPMTKSYSLESSIPTAAQNTNYKIKNEEKQEHAPVKPLNACRNAMTKAVSLMTEGEIVQDFRKMENVMTTHLKGVKENLERFGQTGQKDGKPTIQPKNKNKKLPEEYKPPPPFAPGFC